MAVVTPVPMQSLESFAEVVRRHQSGVCAVAFGVTGDRALSEDIAQDTFVAAWHGLPTLRDPSKLKEWLRGIARNLARKARRKPTAVELVGEVASTDDLERDAIANDEARVTWAALGALPETYREVLVLYYWEDQSAKQVAETLGITEDAAMQRLSRGRALLRDEIQRLVEGTLRRARPGHALTAAILAAVAASTASTASAAGHAANASSAAAGRWPLGKVGSALVALGVVAIVGVIGVSSRSRGASESEPAAGSAIADRATASATVSALGTARGELPVSKAAEAVDDGNAFAGDEPDPDGSYMTVLVEPEGDRAWLSDRLRQALSNCFVGQLIDHPARIAVGVRGGTIATVTVDPFEGSSEKMIALNATIPPSAIASTDLVAWLRAGNPIATTHDNPALEVHDKAMPIGDFVRLCSEAHLQGQAVTGPNGVHHVRLTGSSFTPKKVDRVAYSDLDVATGPSRGPQGARVTIVTFLDIADRAGYGAKALAALGEILARYPDDVRVVVKLCPPALSGHDLAAQAVHAANAQGALWPMLERIGANREQITIEQLVGFAIALQLDAARFRRDLELGTFRDIVELDRDQMTTMEITALPSTIVNGKRVHGAVSPQMYADAVDEALATRTR